MATKRLCSIPDCGKSAHARSFCKSHYERWKLHGDPLKGGTAYGEPLRYLNEIVLPYEGDECLPWPYCNNGVGYGSIYINRRKSYVHRVVCERVHGPAPSPKHQAAHSCGNGHLGCCNPRHVYWATQSENAQDKLRHGTHNRGENNPGAKLTAAQVLEIRELKGKLTQVEIGAKFGVSRLAIHDIHAGKNWFWL